VLTKHNRHSCTGREIGCGVIRLWCMSCIRARRGSSCKPLSEPCEWMWTRLDDPDVSLVVELKLVVSFA